MFSLIIAVVSIALIVALVVVSGYFGGSAVTDAQGKAHAAQLISEERQIFAAMDVFQADNRRWPVNVQELVTTGYLRTAPRGVELSEMRFSPTQLLLAVLPAAHAADASGYGWSMPKASTPIIYTATNVPKHTCQQYNLTSRGDDGILRQPYATLLSQCYGEEGAYRVLVRKQGFELDATIESSVGVVAPGAIPDKDSGSAWTEQPSGATGTPPVVVDPVDPAEPGEAPSAAMARVDFGGVQAGATTIRDAVLQNTGDVALQLGGPTLTGDGFAVTGTSCGASLAVGSSCNISVSFTAEGMLAKSGLLRVPTAEAGTVSAALAGQGLQSSLSVTPATDNLVTTLNGSVTSATHTLRNVGNQGITGLTFTMPEAFTLQNSTCLSTLAASGYCSFKVQFAPVLNKPHAGNIDISGDQGTSTQIAVTGQVQVATATLTDIDFGIHAAGVTSTKNSTLKNTGTVALSVDTSTAVVTGAGFTYSRTNCPASLAPSGSCTVTVVSVSPAVGLTTAGTLKITTGAGALQAGLKDNSIIQKVTFTLGSQGVGAVGTDGSSGGATTFTFAGQTVVAGGGQAGQYATGANAAGGSFSGGTGGSNGGTGIGATGGNGAGGGGGIGGSDGFAPPGTGAGGNGAAPNDVNGLQSAVVAAGATWGVPGAGGAIGLKGGNTVGYGAGGGGAGNKSVNGGEAGLTSWGGGGGGGSGSSGGGATRGGHGGPGALVIQFIDGTAVVLTSGTSYTASGKSIQTIWAIGGGGAGGGVPTKTVNSGGGGGAGGVAYLTVN